MHTLLLQSATDDMIVYLFMMVIFFVIAIFIIRWVFKIDSIVTNLKRQTYELTIIRQLLIKVATKQELTPEETKNIQDTASAEIYK